MVASTLNEISTSGSSVLKRNVNIRLQYQYFCYGSLWRRFINACHSVMFFPTFNFCMYAKQIVRSKRRLGGLSLDVEFHVSALRRIICLIIQQFPTVFIARRGLFMADKPRNRGTSSTFRADRRMCFRIHSRNS